MTTLKIHENGFIGQTKTHNSEFCYVNEEQEYYKALETQPVDWIYRDYPILYNYNKYGHRTVELEQLSDEYVLFTGCSITEGHGLRAEDRYSDIVARELKLDCYNMALKGASIDITMFNLFAFLSIVKIKPKMIFIQWPAVERMGFTNLVEYASVSHWSIDKFTDKEVYNFMLKHEVVTTQQIYNAQFTKKCLTNMGIKFLDIDIHAGYKELDIELFLSKHPNEYLDLARDFDHAGIKTNQLWAKKILEKII